MWLEDLIYPGTRLPPPCEFDRWEDWMAFRAKALAAQGRLQAIVNLFWVVLGGATVEGVFLVAYWVGQHVHVT